MKINPVDPSLTSGMIVRRLVGRHLHHLHHHRKLHGKSHFRSGTEKFSLNLIVPPSGEVEKVSFGNMTAFLNYLRTYNGSLCTVDSAGQKTIVAPQQYKALSPVQTYKIDSPFLMPIRSVQHYEQISDKAFEDKARKTMITSMNNAGMAFNELARVVKDGERVVAEWEGVFEVDNGQRVYFLGCKQRMTADILVKQKRRMVNSMNALKKPEGLGKVFLAGEYWEGGDETQRDALVLGYGVLCENGNDLSVLGDM